MVFYKFLAAGAVGPFSGFRWPVPGAADEWVEVEPPHVICRNGVHLCRTADLPLWMHEELYAVEVDGPVEEHDGLVLAGRARLVRRVGGWRRHSAWEFSQDCAARLRGLGDPRLSGYAQDAAVYAGLAGEELGWATAAATTGYIAAAAVRAAAGPEQGETAARTERIQQARWLSDHVLPAGL